MRLHNSDFCTYAIYPFLGYESLFIKEMSSYNYINTSRFHQQVIAIIMTATDIHTKSVEIPESLSWPTEGS